MIFPLAWVYAAVFTLTFVAARLRGPAWCIIDGAVIVWGLSYVVGFSAFFWLGAMAVNLVFGPAPDSFATWGVMMTVAIGTPGVITALLVGWAYRNRRVAGWILLATWAAIVVAVATAAASPVTAPLVWHAVTVLTLFHYRPRPRPSPHVQGSPCTACGYSLDGLPHGARCPECGTDPPAADAGS